MLNKENRCWKLVLEFKKNWNYRFRYFVRVTEILVPPLLFGKLRKTKMLMYKNIICLFFFSFYYPKCTEERERERGRGRERDRWGVENGWACTHRSGLCGSSAKLLRLTSFITFPSLIHGHLKALNHLSFSSLLYSEQHSAQTNLTSTSFLLQFSPLHSNLLVIEYSGCTCKFSWSHLQLAANLLHVDTLPSIVRCMSKWFSNQYPTRRDSS